MFTFILFIILSGFCFILYVYFNNKVDLLRKQMMLVNKQNLELKSNLEAALKELNAEKSKSSEDILMFGNNPSD